jgi:hypothetical protein
MDTKDNAGSLYFLLTARDVPVHTVGYVASTTEGAPILNVAAIGKLLYAQITKAVSSGKYGSAGVTQ